MIEVINITVNLEDKLILEDISCIIPERKSTVIIGKSGSGKSVLVKTIAGLLKPVSGDVLIDGESICKAGHNKLKIIRQKMSMLFQGAALFDSMNVYQNVALPLFEHTKLKESEIIKIVEEKLDLVGLKYVMDKMPSDLSGGMRKRVGLARAITLEPKYIIYDEPTTGLDPITSAEITHLIASLQKKCNYSSIIITHDQDCIEKTAEHVIFIQNRKIIFQGEYTEFKSSPFSRVWK